jgi:transcriptional regulator with XRE-family HTH domain
MNFDFLRAIAQNETDSPLACSSIFSNAEMSPLGALIWNARVHMNLSQNEFAENCGVDVDDIIRIEEESNYTVDIRTIYAISKFLNIENSVVAEIAGFIKLRDPLYQQQLYSFAESSGQMRNYSDVKIEIFEQYLAVLQERSLQSG